MGVARCAPSLAGRSGAHVPLTEPAEPERPAAAVWACSGEGSGSFVTVSVGKHSVPSTEQPPRSRVTPAGGTGSIPPQASPLSCERATFCVRVRVCVCVLVRGTRRPPARMGRDLQATFCVRVREGHTRRTQRAAGAGDAGWVGGGPPPPLLPSAPPCSRGGRAVRRGAWRWRRAGCCCCWAASWCAAGRGPSRAGRRGSGKGAACATITARAATRGPLSLTTASTSASASWRRGRRSSPARSRWRGKGPGSSSCPPGPGSPRGAREAGLRGAACHGGREGRGWQEASALRECVREGTNALSAVLRPPLRDTARPQPQMHGVM